MTWRWGVIFIPVVLSLLLLVFFVLEVIPNPVIAFRVSASILVLVAGISGSAIVVFGVVISQRMTHLRAQGVESAHQQASVDRRHLLQRLDHELKNPLTAIRAGVANIAEAPSEESRQKAITSTTTQLVRLSRLVTDLRKLTDLETRPVERTSVDVGTLLQNVMSSSADRLETADRHVTLTLPQAPWPLAPIISDRDLLFLAFHNLLDNALKFSQLTDTIEIRAFEEGTDIVIEVADTDPGIPETEVPTVWEELSRGQAARSVPGTGLGLALVRAVILRHYGQVALRSRIEQGTVVTVRLPRS